MRMPLIDLFAYRLSDQIAKYFADSRPTQFSYECNATRMEPENSVYISSIFVKSGSICKIVKE